METKIYGASDDLIEFDGAIYEEYGGLGRTITCSDGTKFTIDFDGEWKINVLEKGDRFSRVIESVGDDNSHTDESAIGYSSYSDVMVLLPGIEWIEVSGATGKKRFKANNS